MIQLSYKGVMKVLKRNFIDLIILILIFFQLVFLGYFGLNGILNKIISALIIIRLFLICKTKYSSLLLFCGLFVFAFYFVSIQGIFNKEIFKSNLLLMLYPFLYACYFLFINEKKEMMVKSLILSNIKKINMIFIIHNIIMIFQRFGRFIAIHKEHLTINDSNDVISGLFPYASTHAVALYNIFIIFINYYWFKNSRSNSKKRKYLVTIIFFIILESIIALFNDNKAFFILLPLSCILLFVVNVPKKNLEKIQRYMKVLLFLIMAVMAMFCISPLWDFVNKNIMQIIRDAYLIFKSSDNVVGTYERIAMIDFAFSLPTTFRLGVGLSYTAFGQTGMFGFKHFGQSDFPTLLILGGVWYVVGLILFYAYVITRVIDKRRKRNIIYIFLFLIMLSVYTQCFTRTYIFTSVLLIALSIKYIVSDK